MEIGIGDLEYCANAVADSWKKTAASNRTVNEHPVKCVLAADRLSFSVMSVWQRYGLDPGEIKAFHYLPLDLCVQERRAGVVHKSYDYCSLKDVKCHGCLVR